MVDNYYKYYQSADSNVLDRLQQLKVGVITEKVNAIWESMVPHEAHSLWGYTQGWSHLYVALGGAGALILLMILWNGLCSVFCKRNRRTMYPRYGPKRDAESFTSNKVDYEPLVNKPEKQIDVLDRIHEVNNITEPNSSKKDYNSFD